jgi:hypothetical protein
MAALREAASSPDGDARMYALKPAAVHTCRDAHQHAAFPKEAENNGVKSNKKTGR